MITWQEAHAEYLFILRNKRKLFRQLSKTNLIYVKPWDSARLERKGQRRKYWFKKKAFA